VSAGLPGDTRDIIARRRERRTRFQKLELPESWVGVPTPIVVAERPTEDGGSIVTGIGASAGVAEGLVRVVLDPAFTEVQPEEILVAPTTDPSWAAVMYISKALVVDIGGALSHAAIVARELGVPCVVNTGDGSNRLRTGDRVRVDGTAGTIEILDRADAVG
jgi:phosphoenolpyruvate synthase/pyruvate phosphate dikinase